MRVPRMAVHGVRPAGTGPETKEGGFDVAVLGGTGFIGARVVKRFLAAGLRVGVTARNPGNLPPVFDEYYGAERLRVCGACGHANPGRPSP